MIKWNVFEIEGNEIGKQFYEPSRPLEFGKRKRKIKYFKTKNSKLSMENLEIKYVLYIWTDRHDRQINR